jgi:hypothetical protein
VASLHTATPPGPHTSVPSLQASVSGPSQPAPRLKPSSVRVSQSSSNALHSSTESPETSEQVVPPTALHTIMPSVHWSGSPPSHDVPRPKPSSVEASQSSSTPLQVSAVPVPAVSAASGAGAGRVADDRAGRLARAAAGRTRVAQHREGLVDACRLQLSSTPLHTSAARHAGVDRRGVGGVDRRVGRTSSVASIAASTSIGRGVVDHRGVGASVARWSRRWRKRSGGQRERQRRSEGDQAKHRGILSPRPARPAGPRRPVLPLTHRRRAGTGGP